MTTPEGKIKDSIKKVLKETDVYAFMPVQMGYGAAGLDFHCIVLTKTGPMPFFIESKAPGKKPTLRQENIIEWLRIRYQCKVWVIDNQREIDALELWLKTITEYS